MKFVDEAIIKVLAGNGGRGAVSFRREKFIPFGGPDGGDGGLGGSVYAVATAGINTLADFRVQRTFRAVHGTSGGGNDRSGAGGDDFEVQMPVGTVLVDSDTEEQLGDLVNVGERILVAKGGKGGWGNARFKSSTNRTPRKAQPGLAGEQRTLKLELKLIADVGLLGFPNAGKSTLISAVSAARPKVADYPFTTLHPNLGVVSVGAHRSFVMADIPGLIEGAAEGAGLGLRFLKHLQRTGLLLHLVDILPPDPDADPVKDARAIIGELKKFSPDLEAKERWLVLNKLDLLPPDEAEQRCKEIVRQLRWRGPVYKISGLAHSGTAELCQAVMRRLEEVQAARALAEKNEAAQENVEAEKIAATISAMIGSITIGSIKSGKTARPEKSQERTDQKKVPVKKVAIKKVARKKAPTKKSQAQKPGAKKSSSKKSAAKKAKRVVAIAKSSRAAPRRVQKQNLSVSNKKR